MKENWLSQASPFEYLKNKLMVFKCAAQKISNQSKVNNADIQKYWEF